MFSAEFLFGLLLFYTANISAFRTQSCFKIANKSLKSSIRGTDSSIFFLRIVSKAIPVNISSPLTDDQYKRIIYEIGVLLSMALLYWHNARKSSARRRALSAY